MDTLTLQDTVDIMQGRSLFNPNEGNLIQLIQLPTFDNAKFIDLQDIEKPIDDLN